MNASIVLLSVAGFIAAATTRVCDALLPNIARTFEVPISTASLAVTSFTFAYGLFQLLYGPIGARIGPYRTVAITTLLGAAGTIACAFAPSLYGLAGARAFSGAITAAIIPMSMAYIGETVPYEQRQTVIARFLMGHITGFIFGISAAGLFAELVSWRQLFMLLAAGYVIVAVFLFRMLASGRVASEVRLPVSNNPIVQYGRILQIRWARIVLLTAFFEGFIAFGAFPYLSAHLNENFGLSDLAIGLVMASFGLGGVFYVIGVRKLLKLLDETGFALLGGTCLLAAYGIMAAAPIWPVLALAVPLLGFGFYMLHNTLQTNATQMASFDRSAAISLFAFALFTSQAIGAALAGYLSILTGYRLLFALAGLGLIVLALLFRQAKAQQLNTQAA